MLMHFKTNVENHVGQEEDEMRKELQHALTQESSVYHDNLQQALRQRACQEEYADAPSGNGAAETADFTTG